MAEGTAAATMEAVVGITGEAAATTEAVAGITGEAAAITVEAAAIMPAGTPAAWFTTVPRRITPSPITR